MIEVALSEPASRFLNFSQRNRLFFSAPLPVVLSVVASLVAAPRSEICAVVGLGSYIGANAADLRAWRAASPVTSRLTLAKINELAKKLDELTTFSTSTTDCQSYRKVLASTLSQHPNLHRSLRSRLQIWRHHRPS